MSSTTLYAVGAVVVAALTALAFSLHGGGSYMFVLYGSILAVVLAGFAYDEHRASEPAVARAR
ncbi:MAG: hypothetical protein ACOC06_07635 [Halorubrum sp.]